MTYNLLWGGVGREGVIRDVINAIRPDIAVFTEVITSDSFTAIADTVGPYRTGTRAREGREYPAIVSRWPLRDERHHGPRWAPQKFVAATVHPFGGPALTVHGVHFVAQPLWPFELWRSLEAGALVDELRTHDETPHLIAGDFNALARGDSSRRGAAPIWVRAQSWLQFGLSPRWSVDKLTRAGYLDCYRICEPTNPGFTVPAWDPSVRIDYIFASPDLRTVLRSAGIGETKPTGKVPARSLAQLLGRTPVSSLDGLPSDHVPVWADFEWSEGSGAPDGVV
jgi:endonuclease/exonuclease/phosphatase family metal-dependent hydrolase